MTTGSNGKLFASSRVFELVIFDNDGVLVDSERLANEVLVELLTAAGVRITYETAVAQFMGRSLSSVRRVTESRIGTSLPADFEDRYHALLFERFRRGLRPIRDVEWALDHIDIPMCVASSGSRERIRLSLDVTGLLDRFVGRTYSAEDVTNGKPAPDLFLFAADRMGVTPDRCAVVEDTPVGVGAANDAGMTSFGFAETGAPERLRHASGGVFSTMRELPALLSQPGARRD